MIINIRDSVNESLQCINQSSPFKSSHLYAQVPLNPIPKSHQAIP